MCSITWHRFPGHAWMTPGGNSERRKALKENNALPAISEIKSRLGSPMAHIFFQSMADYTSATEQLGLGEPLVGPKEDMWVSPSDLLRGKVLLSVPHTPRCLQSLTHQAILYKGKQYEYEVEKNTLKRIKEAVDQVTEVLTNEKHVAVEDAIMRTRAFEQEKYELFMEQLRKEIDQLIKKSTDELQKRLLQEAQADKEEALKNLHECMEKQIASAVEYKEKYLIKKFNFRLMWEGNKYYEFYRNKIFNQQRKWSDMFEKARLLFCKEIKKIKTELEAKHVTDLMKIYHETATKVNQIKETTERELKLCLEEKDKYLHNKDIDIVDSINDNHCKDDKIRLLKEKIIDLIHHFQEFIQFTMQDRPSQTQYLLSLQQIEDDICEVDQKVVPRPSDSRENIEIVIAIIFDIITKHYCKTKEETEEVRKPLVKTFEERVDHERAAKKAIDLIVTGIKSENKDGELKKNLDNLVERVETVKQILMNNPSIYQFFEDTKDAVKKKKRDIQLQSVYEEDYEEERTIASELRVCRPCNVHQQFSVSQCYLTDKPSEFSTEFEETNAKEKISFSTPKKSRCVTRSKVAKNQYSRLEQESNALRSSFKDQRQSGSSQRKSSTRPLKLSSNNQSQTNKNKQTSKSK